MVCDNDPFLCFYPVKEIETFQKQKGERGLQNKICTRQLLKLQYYKIIQSNDITWGHPWM